jgi:hypothetical protein
MNIIVYKFLRAIKIRPFFHFQFLMYGVCCRPAHLKLEANTCISIKFLFFTCFNPIINITPGKPLVSSGCCMTLPNREMYYLSPVNYAPATTDLILIRINTYLPRARGGGLTANFLTHLFYKGHYYPAALPHNISRGNYLPSKIYSLVLACIKADIHILSFCHDKARNCIL